MSRELVFVDTETTGLDPNNDILWELSYAVGNGQVETLYFGVTEVPPFIDELTKFTARGCHLKPRSSPEEFDAFFEATKDKTMVSANPPHDKGFLVRAGLFNFHYRIVDIESYAMHALSLDYNPGMRDIFNVLKDHGFDLAQPDHSAAGDVISMRQMFYILRDEFPAEKRR